MERCHCIPSFVVCVCLASVIGLRASWIAVSQGRTQSFLLSHEGLATSFTAWQMIPLPHHKTSSFLQSVIQTENGSKKTAICLWNISNKKSCFSQALSHGPDHAGLSTDLQDVSFLMSSQSLLFNHGQQITHTKAQVSHNIKKNKIKPVVPHLLHAQKTSCTAPGQWKLESVVESSQLPFCCALLLPSCLCCKLMLTVFYYFLSGLCYVLVFRKTSPLQSFLQIEVPFSSHFLGQCWQTREVVYCFMSWQLSTLFPIIGLKHCVLENKDFHIFDLSHSGLN